MEKDDEPKKISVAIVCNPKRPIEDLLNFPTEDDLSPKPPKPPDDDWGVGKRFFNLATNQVEEIPEEEQVEEIN